jgi:dethiobiotin synthetase
MRSTDESPRRAGLRVVLVGTGTEVGKTHVACALLSVWSARSAVVGLKPVETGIALAGDGALSTGGVRRERGSSLGESVRGATRTALGSFAQTRQRGRGMEGGGGGAVDQELAPAGFGIPVSSMTPGRMFHVKRADQPGVSDQERLATAARMFHVKQSTQRTPREHQLEAAARRHPLRSLFAFPEPVSPHLAARDVGTRIDIGLIERWVRDHQAPITVIETAGGLFSPLGHGATNFELMQALRPDAIILVASDRLGVLHELTTTIALSASRGGPALGVVLSAPAKKDASTGRNAAELVLLGIAHPIVLFPRAPVHAAPTVEAARRLIAWIEHGDAEQSPRAGGGGQVGAGAAAPRGSSRSRPRSR